jgi:hypothetical protein
VKRFTFATFFEIGRTVAHPLAEREQLQQIPASEVALRAFFAQCNTGSARPAFDSASVPVRRSAARAGGGKRMNRQPLSLDDNECTALMQAAGSIPVELRARFLSALATAIAVTGTRDATAMLEKLQRTFQALAAVCPDGDCLGDSEAGTLERATASGAMKV